MHATWQQLGVRDQSEARSLIELARSAEGVDDAALEDRCRGLLERRGWTCLRPGSNATEWGSADGILDTRPLIAAPALKNRTLCQVERRDEEARRSRSGLHSMRLSVANGGTGNHMLERDRRRHHLT